VTKQIEFSNQGVIQDIVRQALFYQEMVKKVINSNSKSNKEENKDSAEDVHQCKSWRFAGCSSIWTRAKWVKLSSASFNQTRFE